MNTELRDVINSYIEKEKLRLARYVDSHKRGLLIEMVEVMDAVKGEDWKFTELTESDIDKFRLLVKIGKIGELFTREHVEVLENFLQYITECGFFKKPQGIQTKV